MIRDERTKAEFIQYLKDNPDLRFGQALVAFLEYDEILGVRGGKRYDLFFAEFDEEKYNIERIPVGDHSFEILHRKKNNDYLVTRISRNGRRELIGASNDYNEARRLMGEDEIETIEAKRNGVDLEDLLDEQASN